MFGITFAQNGIWIGILLGLVAGVLTNNAFIGIVAAIAASVVCYYAIRGVETLIERGANAGTKAVQNRMNARREQSGR